MSREVCIVLAGGEIAIGIVLGCCVLALAIDIASQRIGGKK